MKKSSNFNFFFQENNKCKINIFMSNMSYLILIYLASYLSFAQENIFILTKNHTHNINLIIKSKILIAELKNILNFPIFNTK